MLYTGLRLDHRLRLWAPTSASRAISAVAGLLVIRLLLVIRANVNTAYVARYYLLIDRSERAIGHG